MYTTLPGGVTFTIGKKERTGESHRAVVDLEVFGQLDELDKVEAVILTPLPVGLHRGQAVHVHALVHLRNRRVIARRRRTCRLATRKGVLAGEIATSGGPAPVLQ